MGKIIRSWLVVKLCKAKKSAAGENLRRGPKCGGWNLRTHIIKDISQTVKEAHVKYLGFFIVFVLAYVPVRWLIRKITGK